MKKVALYIILIILSSIVFWIFSKYYCHCYDKILDDIVLGIYVSVLVVLFIETVKEIKMIFEYSSLEGQWEEYEFDKQNCRLLLVSNKKGDVRIIYEGSNVLTITLTQNDDNRKWLGKLIMRKDYIYIGKAVFHYEKETNKENEHEFGTKKILIPKELNNSDKNFDYIYFIGINYGNKADYGRTVLRRKK